MTLGQSPRRAVALIVPTSPTGVPGDGWLAGVAPAQTAMRAVPSAPLMRADTEIFDGASLSVYCGVRSCDENVSRLGAEHVTKMPE
jgi:hypothetical protein